MTKNILGGARARRTDPVTSHAAGLQLAPKLNNLEAVVLGCLVRRAALGGNSFEVAKDTGLDRVTASPRFARLKAKGLVVRGKLTRPGPTGKAGVVWFAKAFDPTVTPA